MKEILGEEAIFYNPESADDIKYAVKKLIEDKSLRVNLAKKNYEKSQKYSWEKCSMKTFKYITLMYKKYYKTSQNSISDEEE